MWTAIAAESPEIADRAADLVEIEYEEIPGVFDPVEALRRGEVAAVVLINAFLFPAEVARVLSRDGVLVWVNSSGEQTPIYLSPSDLVARLTAARTQATTPLACARSGDWRHPVVGLWPVALREDLRKVLTVEGLHKIEAWTARHGVAIADWPATPVDPFFNVNTPADAAQAERIAAQQCDD